LTHGWSKLAVQLTGVSILLFLGIGVAETAGAGAGGSLIHRRPDAFTALSFSDLARLPSHGRPGEDITVSYTVTVSLLELPADSVVWRMDRSERLSAGSSANRAVVVRLPALQAQSTAWSVQIRLASGEEIHRTIWLAP
jgi:hypothetical protein